MLEDNLNPSTETILPYDVVTLPSEGIFYTNRKKSVKVTYLNASDENLLASQSLQGTGDLVNTLLAKKILDKDIDTSNMPECDKQAVLIFLRNTAFGTKYQVQVTDPKTEKLFDAEVDLSVITTKDIDIKVDENNEFDFYLEQSKKKVKLSLLTPKDEKELRELDEVHKDDKINPYMTKQLEKMVKEIDGERDRMTIAQYIQIMPISDSQSIRKIVRKNTPALKLNTTVKTPSNQEISVTISLGVEFFRPFYGI